MAEIKICSICQKSYTGYGNNAEPVNSGRCCDDCNSEVVIPARIARLYASEEEKAVKAAFTKLGFAGLYARKQ